MAPRTALKPDVQFDDAHGLDTSGIAALMKQYEGGGDVDIGEDDAGDIVENPDGTRTRMLEDGGAEVDFAPGADDDDGEYDHDENIAERMGDSDLGNIATNLLQLIEEDDTSRNQWLETRARGIDLLALKVEDNPGGAGAGSAPLEGMSRVRHPLLLQCVLKFQANARGELLPSNGPVKVRNDGSVDADSLADHLEKDMNHYLTAVATEYYPDTNRLLFSVGYGGSGFKKLYHCPLRERPVSESVDAKDIIVSDYSTDLANAGRITHRIDMRQSVFRRMQLAGVYRNVPVAPPSLATVDPVKRKQDMTQGVRTTSSARPEEQDYTIYECYCELDLPGYEHTGEDGEQTGLPLPYRVSIEKDSRTILEIRRWWKADDPQCRPKRRLVKYGFVDGIGFYGIGLLHILGNSTAALTGAWRLMLDSYMFGNFPGFLYAKQLGRQSQNNFRVPPGGGVPIDTQGMPLSQAVMPLPYKTPGPEMNAFVSSIEEGASAAAGSAEITIGEGKQDAPVGTTLALIEQATKVMDAVHKGLHASQAEEFAILKELFEEDPEAFWRHNKKPQRQWDQETLLAALQDGDLVPVADPNAPSQMHRLMRAQAIKLLSQQSPDLYDPKKVDEYILRTMGVDNAEGLFAPPPDPNQPPPVPPPLQVAQIRSQDQEKRLAADAQKAAADRESRENIEMLRLAREVTVHPDAGPAAANILSSVRQPANPFQ